MENQKAKAEVQGQNLPDGHVPAESDALLPAMDSFTDRILRWLDSRFPSPKAA